jgi:isopentenyl-diphosphate delta-isomerase
MTALARAAEAEARSLIPGIAADGSLYPIEKMEAHRLGARHLAISVFVMDGDALLIQQRAQGKYHSGGLWANTCCSHPNWGEAPDVSARRRLQEELGVALPLRACSVIEYQAAVTNSLIECERVHVFRADADRQALRMMPDPSEVSAVRWANIEALRTDATDHPDRYAPWFRIYLARWPELGL